MVCVERIPGFQRSGQYRSIGMGGSHRTLIGLGLPIKHATADILDLSLNNTLFRSAHSKAYEVAIGKTNFEVVATGSNDILCSFRLWLGKDQKPGVMGLSFSWADARVGIAESPAVRTAARKHSAQFGGDASATF
jgi:hypothetical protein